MDQFLGLFLALSVLAILFLLIPVAYGRTGGYRELASVFGAKRPSLNSAICQRIHVERSFGFFHDFTGVNFYFDDNGFYIFPMFKLWSWSMPTIFIPYSRIEVKKVTRLPLFKRSEISFPGTSLPKLSLSGKFYETIINEKNIT